MADFNSGKLYDELVSAGVLADGSGGCNSNGVVWDDKNNEIQDQPSVQAVLTAHDPTPVVEESIEEMIDRKIAEALTLQ